MAHGYLSKVNYEFYFIHNYTSQSNWNIQLWNTFHILVWTRKENTSDVTPSAKPCSSWRRPKLSQLCSLWRQMLPLTDPWTMTPLCTDPPWASVSATTSMWWKGMTPTGGSGGRCSKTVSSASFHPQLNWRIFGYRWAKSAKLSAGDIFSKIVKVTVLWCIISLSGSISAGTEQRNQGLLPESEPERRQAREIHSSQEQGLRASQSDHKWGWRGGMLVEMTSCVLMLIQWTMHR